MYLSCNKRLQLFARSVYTESQLINPYYVQFTTVQDVLGHSSKLDRDNQNEFLNKLRCKMNDEHDIDYFESELYSPIIKVVAEKCIKTI